MTAISHGRADAAVPLRRLLGITALVGLAVLLVLLAGKLGEVVPNYYGTARAPNSDALGNWFYGAMEFFFFKGFTNELLFRPHVGIFYASILAVFGAISVVPAVFTGVLVGVTGLHAAIGGERVRLMLVGLVAYCVVQYRTALLPVWVDSLNTDFMAFVLTLSALLMMGMSLAAPVREGATRALLYVSFLTAGVAAVIRGPLLLAGPVLWLLFILRARMRGAPWRVILVDAVVAGCLFMAPVLLDGALLAKAGYTGSGMPTLYSVYADPKHELTTEAHLEYIARQPSNAEVVRTFLAFVVSPEGIRSLGGQWLGRLGGDWRTILAGPAGPAAAVLIVMGLALALATARGQSRRWTAPDGVLRQLGLGILLVLLVEHLLLGLLPGWLSVLVVGVVAGFGGLLCGLSYAPVFAFAYVFGTAFLALTGTATSYERIYLTIQIALVGMILAIALEGPGEARRSRMSGVYAGAVASLLAVLYGANFLLDPPMRQTYLSEVAGRQAAIKISADRLLDRSVYFSGGRDVLFTHYDPAPIGSVVFYEAFENPTGKTGEPGRISGARVYNALFENPGRFIAK